jgi:UDP-N-acetylglucosamine 2-epimerase (non-hydrolysing)
MPEEINRIVTDAISDYCFVTEKSGRENLLREGIPSEKVFFVGHVMIDTLLKYRARADASTVLEKLGLIDRHGLQHDSISDYAVLTLHRPSNVDEPLVLRGLIETLQRVAALLPVVFPCHPRTTTKIKEFGLTKWVRTDESIRGGAITAVPPLGYLDFLKLVAEARFVLTDSGGIQEETTVLGIPCITLRENTERPVTVTEGTNVLVGTSGEKILAAVNDVLTRKSTNVRVPELWDGHAARRIVDILVQRACTCGPRLGT